MQSSIVQKLMALLGAVSEAPRPLSFSEIVKKTGLNKSTIHRLLAVATEEQLLRYDKGRKVYLLGQRIYDLVRNADSSIDIQAIALDEMIGLHERYDGNVTFGIPSGLETVYLRILEARSSLGAIQRPGSREPVHCSASGKALMAFLPAKVRAAKLKDYDFAKFTERTVATLEEFEDHLATARHDGFGKNDREQYDNVVGISAPIFNYVGEPVAVLNIWSLYPRHTLDDLLEWTGDLMSAAARVTDLIGGIAPDPAALEESETS